MHHFQTFAFWDTLIIKHYKREHITMAGKHLEEGTRVNNREYDIQPLASDPQGNAHSHEQTSLQLYCKSYQQIPYISTRLVHRALAEN